MNHNLKIQKIILEANRLADFSNRIILIKQAIQIADTNNDTDWGIELRLNLIHYEGYLAYCIDSIPAFAWLLNVYDNTPDLYDEADLLVIYRSLIYESFRTLKISKDQIESMLADYRVRLNRNGFSNRVYYNTVSSWYIFLGDTLQARIFFDKSQEEPKDSKTSDTEAISEMCILLLEKEHDKAITLCNSFAEKCASNKQYSIQRATYALLIYYLSRDKHPRAKEFFNQFQNCNIEQAEYPYQLYDRILVMSYLVKNDKEKAWQYFEQYSVWEVVCNDTLRFHFWLTLLPLFEQVGTKKLNLNQKVPYYQENNIYNISQLHDYAKSIVENLSVAFNVRNKNNHFDELIEKHLTL